MKLFIDVHDKKTKTFPQEISRDEFEKFLGAFEKSCSDEGVAIVRSHVNLKDGRAFCLTLSKTSEAVRRAHEGVELEFETITEVETASPHDTFFQRSAKRE